MWNWISKIEALQNTHRSFAIATVTQVTGSVPRETGAKMVVLEGTEFFGTIGGGHLEQLVLEDARKCIPLAESRVIRYPLGAKTGQCCGGVVEVLIETLNCGPQLYVFGAGHVGQAVCRTLTGTPFRVHAVDERPEWIQSPEIPDSVIRHSVEWCDFVDDAEWSTEKTYAVVMTHRHDTDQEILQRVLSKPFKYLGLIGSRSKWIRFQQRLNARGMGNETLSAVKCPIGMGLLGKTPQEIAISLAAELLQIHYGTPQQKTPTNDSHPSRREILPNADLQGTP